MHTQAFEVWLQWDITHDRTQCHDSVCFAVCAALTELVTESSFCTIHVQTLYYYCTWLSIEQAEQDKSLLLPIRVLAQITGVHFLLTALHFPPNSFMVSLTLF